MGNRRDFIKKSAVAGLGSGFLFSAPKIHKPAFQVASKINVFSKHLQFLDYEEMARMVAKVGFDGVDLTVRPGGHVFPENVKEDLPKAVKACQDKGLEVPMMSTAIRSASQPDTERILSTASDQGIQFYRMNWLKYDHKESMSENLAKFKETLSELTALNQRYKIKGAYQNHSGTSLGSPVWDIAGLLREIDSNWLGCQYDIRHATVEGGNSWPLGLRMVADQINTIDIKDFIWEETSEGWKLKNVPLGEGMVDFGKFFSLLKELKISVPFSMHFEYDLGGAEHGNREIGISTDEVFEAMKRDFLVLRELLARS